LNRTFYKVLHKLFIYYFYSCFISSIIVNGQNYKTGIQFYSGGDKSILPVEIIYFKYELENKNVKLLWGTATEINNYGWDVIRSEDFSQWNKMGFVPGSMGQSNSPRDYSFTDSSITKNSTYYYRLKQIDTDGNYAYTDTVKVMYDLITGINESVPTDNFVLRQNYPNPFNPNTNITYQIPEKGLTTLALYNSLGRLIGILVNEEKPAGLYNFQLSTFQYQLTSGVYFYKIDFQTGKTLQSLIRKMILLK
jgi:hypothetical protein